MCEDVTGMTEIKNYICDICLATYLDAEEAKKCEESHLTPIKIKRMTYRPGDKYPNIIAVQMSDGKTLGYCPAYQSLL